MSLKRGFWLEDCDCKVFVVILCERLPTFCYLCGLVGHGANGCSRRPGGSPEDQDIKEATDGGILPNLLRSMPEGSQVRQIIVGPMVDSENTLVSNDAQEFGSWMLVTRWRNKGRGRGARFSSTRGTHVHQGDRIDAIYDGDSNGKHVDGKGNSGRTRGGHHAHGGKR